VGNHNVAFKDIAIDKVSVDPYRLEFCKMLTIRRLQPPICRGEWKFQSYQL
jgi:hypothetical protein